MLRLRSIGMYSKVATRDYYLDNVLKDVYSLEWLLPERLVELACWNEAMRKLSTNPDTQVSFNLSDKLNLVTGVNGDLLYLYLTPVISEELINRTLEDREWSRTGNAATDREFYKQYNNYVALTLTEDDRDNLCVELRMSVSCDKEKVRLPLDISLELRTILEADRHGASTSEDYAEVEDSYACTTLVLAAATCTVLSSIYWWMENKCERTVTRAAALGQDHVVPACKYYASASRHIDGYAEESNRAISVVKRNLDSAIVWMRELGVKREKMDSAGIMDVIIAHLNYGFALIPASWHIGLVPSLTTVFGSLLVGTWYVSLEEVLGPVLSTGFLITINSVIAAMTPLPMAISCVVSEVLAFVISAIGNKRSTLYDRYGRSVSYPAKAWRLVFGGAAGVALGKMILPSLIVAKPVLISSGAGVAVTSTMGANLGKTGLALNVIKQIYVTLVRIQSHQVGMETLGPVLTAAFSAAALDATTIVVGALVAVGLIAIRKTLEYAKYSVGTSTKSSRANDGRNPYIEDYFGDFDDMALNVLGAATIFSTPSSAISVAIAWINSATRNGRFSGQDFKEAFHVYSGVPIAFTIITEGMKWIASWQANEVNHSAMGLLITVPTALAGVFGSVYYAKTGSSRGP